MFTLKMARKNIESKVREERRTNGDTLAIRVTFSTDSIYIRPELKDGKERIVIKKYNPTSMGHDYCVGNISLSSSERDYVDTNGCKFENRKRKLG